jgi:predicted GIY-YIG superfamily endonuclease
MANNSPFGRDANHLSPHSKTTMQRILDPRCVWRDHPTDRTCGNRCVEDTPVCEWHGMIITTRMLERSRARNEAPPDDADRWPTEDEREAERQEDLRLQLEIRNSTQCFVYYLLLSPTTVKIGTTRDLRTRIKTHGSELQYVVALERGSYDVEKARHEQFPMERHGTKEVFTISDALRRHIESLAPHRDELVAYALTMPREADDTPHR